MYIKNYFTLSLLGIIILLFSCNDALEEDRLFSEKNATQNLVTKALTSDSTEKECVIPLEESEELKALKERMKNLKKQKATVLYQGNNYDENFASNIWAIRELPITLYARGAGNTNNKYLSCEGKNKEVILTNAAINLNEKFYLKILPSTAGIPYLIYSIAAQTPLAVGYYNSNPNNKILYAKPDATGSLTTASWDLIPSQTSKGYVVIESQSYLGQSDPNNMWSVFNYVVEVKNDNKVGYGQYVKKAQQEFQIASLVPFVVQDITFDVNSAEILDAPDVDILSTSRNLSVEPKPYSIPIKKNYSETSYFAENISSIKFNISNASQFFQRPTIQARKVVLPESSTPYDAQYKTTTPQNINKKIEFTIEGDAPENCLIEIVSSIKAYNVSINYTVNASYEDRKIKLSGTWRGYIIADPKLAKPIHVVRFFDLDTNEEIHYFSLSKIKTILNN